jgi:Ohr subfamily peroxiredoxin
MENYMQTLYSAEATATGGRTGSAKSSDGCLAVTLDTVKELGGGGGDGTNPEQLFAAGYAACFLGALKHVANQRKLKVADETTVTATVGIGPREDGQGFELDVALSVTLPGIHHAVAEDLIAQADIVSPTRTWPATAPPSASTGSLDPQAYARSPFSRR